MNQFGLKAPGPTLSPPQTALHVVDVVCDILSVEAGNAAAHGWNTGFGRQIPCMINALCAAEETKAAEPWTSTLKMSLRNRSQQKSGLNSTSLQQTCLRWAETEHDTEDTPASTLLSLFGIKLFSNTSNRCCLIAANFAERQERQSGQHEPVGLGLSSTLY